MCGAKWLLAENYCVMLYGRRLGGVNDGLKFDVLYMLCWLVDLAVSILFD